MNDTVRYSVRIDIVQHFENGRERVIERYEGSDHEDVNAVGDSYDSLVSLLREDEV